MTGYLNNNISAFSSSGFQQDGSTISLVAPGELNWILCSTDTAMYGECTSFTGKPTPVSESGGTSESAPLTAGAAALVIQAYGKTHGGALPSPAVGEAVPHQYSRRHQGPRRRTGVRAPGRLPSRRGRRVLPGPGSAQHARHASRGTSQFNAVAPAGTAESFTEQLTNEGSTPETVSRLHPHPRRLLDRAERHRDPERLRQPHSRDYQGFTDNYEVVHFTVPAGLDRLNGSIAFQGSSTALSARVRLALVDPAGRLADYSLPQGVGNYGDAQVADPAPGTWTAYIWSRDTPAAGPPARSCSGRAWRPTRASAPSAHRLSPSRPGRPSP